MRLVFVTAVLLIATPSCGGDDTSSSNASNPGGSSSSGGGPGGSGGSSSASTTGSGGAGGGSAGGTSTSTSTGSGPMLPCPSDKGDCDGNPANGCETPVLADPNNCGGCGNACPAGFVCNGSHCQCGSNNACGPGGTCVTGTCVCGGTLCGNNQTCQPNMSACACNAGPGCALGETCCSNPAGCINLSSDVQNCGGCNHPCPPGFICQNAGCLCVNDADCNAGTAGTCIQSGASAGRCKCGNTTCSVGLRCQSDGSCG